MVAKIKDDVSKWDVIYVKMITYINLNASSLSRHNNIRLSAIGDDDGLIWCRSVLYRVRSVRSLGGTCIGIWVRVKWMRSMRIAMAARVRGSHASCAVSLRC